jgi:tetratricopeptide (TPR) repeat protein
MREKLAITCVDAGRLYYETNDTRRAEQLWIKAAASDAKNVDSRVLLGTLHSKAGQSAKALKQYEELARIQPNNIDHYQQMGFLQARLGNLAAAESALKQMLKIDPRDAAGHRALAKFYLNTKQQPTAALELAATSVKLQPVADGYFVLGWANAQNGKKHEAVAALEEAIRLAPNNPTYRKLYELVQKGK